jgi:hypothetical protein
VSQSGLGWECVVDTEITLLETAVADNVVNDVVVPSRGYRLTLDEEAA